MSAKQTAELLAAYNLWRRDKSDVNPHAMPEPKMIGEAIDSAVEYLTRMDQVITLIKLGAPDQSTAAIVDLLENGF